jgi:hypothetical protein
MDWTGEEKSEKFRQKFNNFLYNILDDKSRNFPERSGKICARRDKFVRKIYRSIDFSIFNLLWVANKLRISAKMQRIFVANHAKIF